MVQITLRLMAGLFLACGMLACALPQTMQHPYDLACSRPPETVDGWRTAELAEAGLDPDTINRLLHDIHSKTIKNVYAVIVARNGKLLVDEYFNGASRNDIGLIASTTKSLTSILVGIALKEQTGEKTVATPLPRFFPRYAEKLHNQGKEAITLGHVLTMTAGLDWDELTHSHPDERNPNTQMYAVADPVGFILARNMLYPPGTVWNYSSGLSVLLGEVVRDLSGEPVDVFAQQRLFEPLNFTRFLWQKHAGGTVWSNGDLYVRPRDLAKVGQLVLDHGRWQGEQIVSADWIRESTRAHVQAHNGLKYGYQWWIGSARYADRKLEVIFGSGTGGQKLFIIPELDMVVAVLSKVFNNKGGHNRATRILTEYLLPAALEECEPPESPLDPAFAEAATGKYVNAAAGRAVRFKFSGSLLYAKPTIFSQIELKPYCRNSFYGYWEPIGNVYVDFVEDEAGQITGADVHYLLGTFRFDKLK